MKVRPSLALLLNAEISAVLGMQPHWDQAAKLSCNFEDISKSNDAIVVFYADQMTNLMAIARNIKILSWIKQQAWDSIADTQYKWRIRCTAQ